MDFRYVYTCVSLLLLLKLAPILTRNLTVRSIYFSRAYFSEISIQAMKVINTALIGSDIVQVQGFGVNYVAYWRLPAPFRCVLRTNATSNWKTSVIIYNHHSVEQVGQPYSLQLTPDSKINSFNMVNFKVKIDQGRKEPEFVLASVDSLSEENDDGGLWTSNMALRIRKAGVQHPVIVFGSLVTFKVGIRLLRFIPSWILSQENFRGRKLAIIGLGKIGRIFARFGNSTNVHPHFHQFIGFTLDTACMASDAPATGHHLELPQEPDCRNPCIVLAGGCPTTDVELQNRPGRHSLGTADPRVDPEPFYSPLSSDEHRQPFSSATGLPVHTFPEFHRDATSVIPHSSPQVYQHHWEGTANTAIPATEIIPSSPGYYPPASPPDAHHRTASDDALSGDYQQHGGWHQAMSHPVHSTSDYIEVLSGGQVVQPPSNPGPEHGAILLDQTDSFQDAHPTVQQLENEIPLSELLGIGPLEGNEELFAEMQRDTPSYPQSQTQVYSVPGQNQLNPRRMDAFGEGMSSAYMSPASGSQYPLSPHHHQGFKPTIQSEEHSLRFRSPESRLITSPSLRPLDQRHLEISSQSSSPAYRFPASHSQSPQHHHQQHHQQQYAPPRQYEEYPIRYRTLETQVVTSPTHDLLDQRPHQGIPLQKLPSAYMTPTIRSQSPHHHHQQQIHQRSTPLKRSDEHPIRYRTPKTHLVTSPSHGLLDQQQLEIPRQSSSSAYMTPVSGSLYPAHLQPHQYQRHTPSRQSQEHNTPPATSDSRQQLMGASSYQPDDRRHTQKTTDPLIHSQEFRRSFVNAQPDPDHYLLTDLLDEQ